MSAPPLAPAPRAGTSSSSIAASTASVEERKFWSPHSRAMGRKYSVCNRGEEGDDLGKGLASTTYRVQSIQGVYSAGASLHGKRFVPPFSHAFSFPFGVSTRIPKVKSSKGAVTNAPVEKGTYALLPLEVFIPAIGDSAPKQNKGRLVISEDKTVVLEVEFCTSLKGLVKQVRKALKNWVFNRPGLIPLVDPHILPPKYYPNRMGESSRAYVQYLMRTAESQNISALSVRGESLTVDRELYPFLNLPGHIYGAIVETLFCPGGNHREPTFLLLVRAKGSGRPAHHRIGYTSNGTKFMRAQSLGVKAVNEGVPLSAFFDEQGKLVSPERGETGAFIRWRVSQNICEVLRPGKKRKKGSMEGKVIEYRITLPIKNSEGDQERLESLRSILTRAIQDKVDKEPSMWLPLFKAYLVELGLVRLYHNYKEFLSPGDRDAVMEALPSETLPPPSPAEGPSESIALCENGADDGASSTASFSTQEETSGEDSS